MKRRKFLSQFLSWTVLAGMGKMSFDFLSDTLPEGNGEKLIIADLHNLEENNYLVIDQRAIIIKDSHGLYAMSLKCTHLGCTLKNDRFQNGEHIFLECPCHGSSFNGVGERLGGPAPRALPHYKISLNSKKQLVVDTAQEVSATARLIIPS